MNEAAQAVETLLSLIGEDVTRDGLKDTPKRVVRALVEMTSGMSVDVAKLLATTFDAECDQLVILRGIEFTSLCEHHLLPFSGVAHVGYLPRDGRVVGISKLARVTDAFARRLQIQERMTQQIAKAIEEHVGAAAVGVIVKATHSCMSCRGVKQSPEMITSAMLGLFRSDDAARAEFLRLCNA